MAAAIEVYFLSRSKGNALPIPAERMVINAKARSAPDHTITREDFIAKIAATKNVRSPSSHARMSNKD